MSGIYSKKRYGDAEDDDEERCMPPDRSSPIVRSDEASEVRFTMSGQDINKDLQYTPDSRKESTNAAVEKAADKKKDSRGRINVRSLFPLSQVTTASTGNSDDELRLDENVPADNNASQPQFSSRAPRNSSLPGAFHADGRNARDVIGNDDNWSDIAESRQSMDEQSELNLVSAEAVDPDETNRIVERELAERQRKAPVAEVVEGFWCSKRVKRISIAVGLLIVTAVVLGTVLPRVLEPPEPTPAPTASPTPALPYLTGFLSSISSDEGEALQTPSTPQNEALNWLVNDTNLDTYPLEKKVQRYVLATLYYSTNGNNWKRNKLWLSDDDECGWYNEAKASFCVGSEVVNLDLYDDTSGNNLVGTIPNEIGLLSDSLEELNLADNKLMGTIPSEIGVLSNLNELSLWNNSLTGHLPPEIGSLTNLTWVNLRVNGLTGTIISEIGMLTNLKVLSFSVNKLTGAIPSEIGLLTNLNSLFLYNNELTGTIPSEIDLLTHLNDLSLYDNGLTGDYTCPDSIPVCRISCANDTAGQCRSMQVGSSSAPIIGITAPSTPVPSIPPSAVDIAPSARLPTYSPSPLPMTPPTETAFNPSAVPPASTPVLIPSTTETDPPATPLTRPPTLFPSLTTDPPATPPIHLPTVTPSIVVETDPSAKPPPRLPTVTPSVVQTDPPTFFTPSPPPTPLAGGQAVPATEPPTKAPTQASSSSLTNPPTRPPTRYPTSPPSMAKTDPPTKSPITVCGDGIIGSGEECEPNSPPFCPDGQYCDDTSCLCVGCGNGRVDEDEPCDYTAEPTGCDGYCSTSCRCRAGSTRFCGDGIINGPEECEDEVEPFCPDQQICNNDCLCVGCGNGRIDDGEQCDYEAAPSGCDDGGYCNTECACIYGTEPPGTIEAYCGNGNLDDGEECEPGVPPYCPDGQYCDEDCECNGCGNGRIDDGETCDYTVEPDGCGADSVCDSYCTCEAASEDDESPSPAPTNT